MYLIYLALGVLIFICLLAGISFLKRRKSEEGSEYDEFEGSEFEMYCAALLEKNGFYEVEVTKASRDFGADILAEKDMVTYAIQCKVYSTPIGIKAVQEALCGRDYYGKMVGAVLTNQRFTPAAIEAAKRLNIILWDGEYLKKLEEDCNI